ncbi:hypothetical protein V6N13_049763 [Hibiscus sabdariffa]
MLQAKASPTPMVSFTKLVQDGGSPIPDPYEFRSIVGALLYVCHIRPDIAYSVNRAAQFMQRPCEDHLAAVKQILRYLVGTLDYGLLFTASDMGVGNVVAFADADWEAEYRSITDAVSEVTWVNTMLSDMGVISSTIPVVWSDNTSAVAMSANPVLYSRSKHVELDVHFVREKVADRRIQVNYVPAEHQAADGLTKPLSKTFFQPFRHKMSVHEMIVS